MKIFNIYFKENIYLYNYFWLLEFLSIYDILLLYIYESLINSGKLPSERRRCPVSDFFPNLVEGKGWGKEEKAGGDDKQSEKHF